MTPDERQRILRVAEGLRTALSFIPRDMLDTGVRLSIRELQEIAAADASPTQEPTPAKEDARG